MTVQYRFSQISSVCDLGARNIVDNQNLVKDNLIEYVYLLILAIEF